MNLNLLPSTSQVTALWEGQQIAEIASDEFRRCWQGGLLALPAAGFEIVPGGQIHAELFVMATMEGDPLGVIDL